MARDFDTQIKFGVRDNATPKIRSLSEEFRRMSSARESLGIRSEHNIQREISRTVAAYNRLERSGVLSVKEQERAYQRMQSTVSRLRQEMGETLRVQEKMNPALQEYRRQAQARETLGIRSEQSIRREINQTLAAYNRLYRSGTMSASEQTRAWNQTQTTVARLRRELGETERSYQRLARVGKTVGAIGGGLIAGAMVMRKPIENQMEYDSELRKQANFAYSDKDLAGRQAGMKTIDAAIKRAIREGGGDISGAFHAMETMQRSGTMGRDQVFAALPDVMKISSATETDPAAVASLQSSAFNFGLNEKDAHAGLSVATTMSQHGMVDMSLLAKEMPKALESAKSIGLHGRTGYSQVGALFEAAARGAGSPEEAATFTTNLLSELSAPTLANNFKQAKIGKRGIDIRALIRADAAKGLTPLDTVDRGIRAMDEHDPQFVALEKQISRTAPGEARAQLEARRDQIHGQNVGRIFTNEYSRMGFLNWERNKDYYHKLIKEGNAQFDMPEGHTSADLDYNVVADSTSFKVNKAKNEAIVASNDTAAPLAKSFGDVADKASELAKEFPKLTTAISGAYSTIQGFGAAGGAGLGALALAGGQKLWKRFKGGGSAIVEEAAETAAKGGSFLSKGGSLLGKVVRAPLAEGFMAYNQFYDQFLERGDDKIKRLKEDGYNTNIPNNIPKPVGFLDAFDEIKNFFSQNNTAKPASKGSNVPYAPQGPQQPVVANIYLDSREVTDAVLRRIDVDSRRQ
ncbi:phage tail tape measure protein [Hafnia alvei]|uniref:Phage tail tape measure protein, TP901 family n=1 Tax=Hafnia alvei ATCC 51873 TaxID=1002364 RepID=G9Y0H3_HAFAL|nr:phage tail tape measure protein [Hafnia alvei]EHM48852.1 phage tail tape measure protein, TP901 family [Hafnia alvei ATCC 51873]QQE44200.1 phage tail tape measure protein [Hafnia alvei]